MIIKNIYVFGLVFFASVGMLCAQTDTIRMMQYNLMYYTNQSGVSECNSVTNNLDAKDANINTIFQYVKPTVMCVCEIGSQTQYADRLLNNAINTDGIDYYRHGPLTNYSGGLIANMIFYDSRKLTFYKNHTVTTSYRDINGYQFYYNASDLSIGDTTFITFWIAHLKAGSSISDETNRLIQVQRLLNKITQLGVPGNHLFSGDLNFYDSEEPAYKELVEYSNSLYRFYDPANSPGYWHNNPQFAELHTQSTHVQSDGCFVAGGLDDRFDFILASPYVYFGSDKVHIIEGSYHALGQDGSRFNGSILTPSNSTIPTHVANALYNQSDHLPVIMDMTIDTYVGMTEHRPNFFLNVTNPTRDVLNIELQNEKAGRYDISLFSTDGRRLIQHTEKMDPGTHRLSYPLDLPKGVYIVVLQYENGDKVTRKIVHL